MNSQTRFILRVIRHFFRKSEYTERYVEYFGQQGNDMVRESIEKSYVNHEGLFVGKFGTIELKSVVGALMDDKRLTPTIFYEYIRDLVNIDATNRLKAMCNNSGFFPADLELLGRFNELMLADMKDVDILGSNVYEEKYVLDRIQQAKKIQLDSYLAPFLWDNPWTSTLKGKRVVVVHPFAESIQKQYSRRTCLFDNNDVLPEFQSLRVVKAVQTIAGQPCDFHDWFEAFEFMKHEIGKEDFDIAIIGCGAYGFPLAAHVKRMGKIAIHMAGWTQMLFGIYGNRWLRDQPQYSKYINEYWIRPSDSERPKNSNKVENGAYW